MDRLTRYKIGKIIFIIGAVCLGLFGFMLILMQMGNGQTDKTKFYVSLVGTCVAVVCLVVGFVLAWSKGKDERQKIAKYASYPDSKISDYKAELEKVRQNFELDSAPNKNLIVKANFMNSKPAYDFSVIKNGKIYYSYLVEANNKLFKDKMDLTLPAVVVYSTDEYYESNPQELKKIAEALFANRANNILRNEREYFFNLKLPAEKYEGRNVYMTTIMIYRPHLPLNYLSDSLLPIIANPERSKSVFVADAKYWTDELIGAFVHSASLQDDTPEDDIF